MRPDCSCKGNYICEYSLLGRFLVKLKFYFRKESLYMVYDKGELARQALEKLK